MKYIVTALLFCVQTAFAQQASKNITIYGTPTTDSARKALEGYDTVFVYSAFPLPEGIPSCEDARPRMYPAQQNDDYLHEERFDSVYHVVIFDHIATRKMLNVFIPSLNDPNANLCGVNLNLKNPVTGQVVVFHDVFNWMNNKQKQIFNTNREVHNLWGFSSGVKAFPVKLYHVPTGKDFTFGHSELKIYFRDLKME
ncbi:MAG: hypothetical protein ACKVPJ_04340 [Chitinophagales bacterium]